MMNPREVVFLCLCVTGCLPISTSFWYDAFPTMGSFDSEEALTECYRQGGSLPYPSNKEESNNFADFMRATDLASAWLDLNVSLFPWVELSGGSRTPVFQQGCFRENVNFKEEFYEGRFTFNMTTCLQACSAGGYAFAAVKGRESGGNFKVDTISCMCSKSLRDSVQVSRRRCPYTCSSNTEWCKVDRLGIPDLLVFTARSDSVVTVNWDNEEFHLLSNENSCAGSNGAAISKTKCWSKQEVICVHNRGTQFPANLRLSWPEAWQYCTERDSHLPTMREAIAIPKERQDTSPFWISVSARQLFRQSGGSLLSYTNWSPSHTDSAPNAACVTINTDGHWVESVCDAKLPLVCQFEGSAAKRTRSPPSPEGAVDPSHTTPFVNLYAYRDPEEKSDGGQTSPDASNEGKELSLEAIIGIVAIALLFCVMLSIIVATVVIKRRSTLAYRGSIEYVTPPPHPSLCLPPPPIKPSCGNAYNSGCAATLDRMEGLSAFGYCTMSGQARPKAFPEEEEISELGGEKCNPYSRIGPSVAQSAPDVYLAPTPIYEAIR